MHSFSTYPKNIYPQCHWGDLWCVRYCQPRLTFEETVGCSVKWNALIITVMPQYTLIFECTKASNSTVWLPHGTNTPILWIIVLIISCHSDIWNVHVHFRCIEVLQPGCDRFLLGWRDRRWLRRGSDERGRPREYCQVGINVWNKQRVLMHGHQGWNVRHGLCHIYMRYVYIYMSCL